jgi:hypothetical protein
MNYSKKLAAGITAISLAAAYGQAFANPYQQARMKPEASTTAIENSCQQLSWEAANRLPSWIKGSDVACMSPTVEDMQASEQALVLLVKAAGRVQDQNTIPASQAQAEYNDGVVAYAEGRYADAITHFQAAMPSVSRVQFEH